MFNSAQGGNTSVSYQIICFKSMDRMLSYWTQKPLQKILQRAEIRSKHLAMRFIGKFVQKNTLYATALNL